MTARDPRGKCKDCGAPVIFAINETDREWKVFDSNPAEDGRWNLYRRASDPNGSVWAKLMLNDDEWPEGSIPRQPHWMTCRGADAQHWRKNRSAVRSPKTSPEDQHRIEEFLERRKPLDQRAIHAPSPFAAQLLIGTVTH